MSNQIEKKRSLVASKIYPFIFLIKKPKLAITYGLSIYKRAKEQNYLKETFIEQHYIKLARSLKPDTHVLDIGSAIGDTACYFAQFPNLAHIDSFEMNKEFYEESKRNFTLSPFEEMISVKHTIFDKEQLLEYLLSTKNPIVIKADVEGSELEIFSDVVFPENVYGLMIETHDSKHMLIPLLESQGFKVEYKPSVLGVIFKELGMIYAYRETK